MAKCKWCGEEFNPARGRTSRICRRCGDLIPALPRFIKARDNLRELCGLERMGRNRG